MVYNPSYKASSPYSATPIKGRFMGYYVHRAIPPDSRDGFYVVKSRRYHQRPGNLAFDLYGDDDLWWTFGVRNHLEDLMYGVKMGVGLVLPNPNYLEELGIKASNAG